jgi:hypothetical protein
MLRRVVLVGTRVSEEGIASIMVTRIIALRLIRLPITANVVHSSPILVTLMMEAILSFETPVFYKNCTA